MAEHNLQLALYFLEMLYSKGPLPLNLVAEVYQSKICPQQIISYDYLLNETVLFLKQYPSLFQTDSEFVFPASNDNSCHSEPLPSNNIRPLRLINRRLSVDDNDLALESEAVKYFQNHLIKKEDKWIPIKSLAGHLSQASDNIRLVIGNQSLFTAFLMRHSHVFEIQGELVGLKDNFMSNKSFSNSVNGRRKSKVNQSLDSKSVKSDDTNTSDSNKSNQNGNNNNKKRFIKDFNKNSQTVSNFIIANASKMLKGENNQNTVTIALTATDYKTIMYLYNTIRSIEETACECNLANLMVNIIRNSSNNVTSIVGFTQIELEEYLNKHALFFDILDGTIVKTSDISNVNIIISDNCNLETMGADTENISLANRKGLVYHVAKLWGIIDLGQHEHVFFDKSIFKNIENLEKYFQIGEKIYFNAVLASKDSRAKWRATRVWKEADNPILQETLSKNQSDNAPLSNVGLIMPEDIDFSDDDFELELIKQNKLKNHINGFDKIQCDSEDENTMKSIQSIGIEEDLNTKLSYSDKINDSYLDGSFNCNIGTQTLSTGEIMAMHFYHDHSDL